MDKNDRLQDEFCLGGVWPSVHQDTAKLTGADQRPPKAIAAHLVRQLAMAFHAVVAPSTQTASEGEHDEAHSTSGALQHRTRRPFTPAFQIINRLRPISTATPIADPIRPSQRPLFEHALRTTSYDNRTDFVPESYHFRTNYGHTDVFLRLNSSLLRRPSGARKSGSAQRAYFVLPEAIISTHHFLWRTTGIAGRG